MTKTQLLLVSVAALAAAACGSSDNGDLFAGGGSGGAGANAGNNTGGSSPGSGGFTAGGGNSGGGGSAGGPGGSGGTAGTSNGGTANGGSGGTSGSSGTSSGGTSGEAGTAGSSGTAGAGGEPNTTPVCGDGKIEGSEGCDDQNNNPNDGCTNGCVVQCNDVHPEATQFQNHCYWRNTDDAPWAVASAACVAGGGHLVTIASQAENDFLSNLHEWFWIGATDGRGRMVPGVGTYTWVTGEPWDYTNWEQDRPNAQGNDCGASICYEHCAELQADGTWNDLDCGRQPGRDSVCEWDPPGQ